MICAGPLSPLLLQRLDIDPKRVTVVIYILGIGGWNIGAKKAIALSSCPVARALASFHSSIVISKFE